MEEIKLHKEPKPSISNLQDRAWQIEAFHATKDQSFAIIEAPCGSGKSELQVKLACYDIQLGQKQLILVPQRQISKSFDPSIKPRIAAIYPEWNPINLTRLDASYPLRTRKQTLAQFLLHGIDPKFPYIATNQLFALVWEKFTPAQRLLALRNLTIRPDEFHHSSTGDSDAKTITMLGKALDFAINHKELGVKIFGTTGTYFRNDGNSIINHPDLFKHHQYTWDEYWHNDTHIDDIQFKYESYDADPLDQIISNIKKEPQCHHLIIIPNLKRRKKHHLHQLITQLNSIYRPEQILDYTTKKTQEAASTALYADMDKGAIKVVIACKKFDEGTDWEACNRIHNWDCERSPGLTLQRIGRGMRDYKNKNSLVVIFYTTAFKNFATAKEAYDKHVSLICLSMIIRDSFRPLKMNRLNYDPQDKIFGRKGVKIFDLFGKNSKKFMEAFRFLADGETSTDEFEWQFEELVKEYTVITDYDLDTVKKVAMNIVIHHQNPAWIPTLDYSEILKSMQAMFCNNSNIFSISKEDMDVIRSYYNEKKKTKTDNSKWMRFYNYCCHKKYDQLHEVKEATQRRWFRDNAYDYCNNNVTVEKKKLLDRMKKELIACYNRNPVLIMQENSIENHPIDEFQQEEEFETLHATLSNRSNLYDGQKIAINNKICKIFFETEEIVLQLEDHKHTLFRRNALLKKALKSKIDYERSNNREPSITLLKKLRYHEERFSDNDENWFFNEEEKLNLRSLIYQSDNL